MIRTPKSARITALGFGFKNFHDFQYRLFKFPDTSSTFGALFSWHLSQLGPPFQSRRIVKTKWHVFEPKATIQVVSIL
jgi:hypothetical protein